MIKAKKGKVTLNGYTLDLLQEYSNITTSMIRMLEDEGMTKEDIKELMTNIVENEFLTGEEVKQKIVQVLEKLFEPISEILSKTFSKEEKEAESNE